MEHMKQLQRCTAQSVGGARQTCSLAWFKPCLMLLCGSLEHSQLLGLLGKLVKWRPSWVARRQRLARTDGLASLRLLLILASLETTICLIYTMMQIKNQLLGLLACCLLACAVPVKRGLLALAPDAVLLGDSATPPLSTVQSAAAVETITKMLVSTQQVTAMIESVSIVPTTVIDSVLATQTVVSFATSTLTVVQTPSIASATPASRPADALQWAAPSVITNLSQDLGISTFAWGEKLASVLPAVPTSAFGPTPSSQEKPVLSSVAASKGDVLAVTFPAGSANPAAEPQGGIGFYASPIDISSANNVTLSYSVFFPHDFDFVKGGKLPGLYGGHGGCSGGAAANDCFSTRLMWRQDGAGELYLYAPRGDQPKALCTLPPLTYCDTEYGSSIGRGSFSFAVGNWTDVREDIWLNTPGKADGGFNLWINQKLALSSTSVLFRGAPKSTSAKATKSAHASATKTKSHVSSPTSSDTLQTPDGIAQGILGGLARRTFIEIRPMASIGPTLTAVAGREAYDADDLLGSLLEPDVGELAAAASAILDQAMSGSAVAIPSASPTLASRASSSSAEPARSTSTPDPLIVGDSTQNHVLAVKKPVGFQGIMYDCFFGGSSQGYATPKNQTVYFASLALAINA